MKTTQRLTATFAGVLAFTLATEITGAEDPTNKHQKGDLQKQLKGIAATLTNGMLAQKQNSDTVLISAGERAPLLEAFRAAFNKVNFPRQNLGHDALMEKSSFYAKTAAAILGDNVVSLGAGGHRQHQGADSGQSAKLRTGTGD